jgi:esterase/lipase superfamily enzyme
MSLLPCSSCLFRVLCVLLFNILPLLPASGAEILGLTVIHDGSIDPPGFKVEATLRFSPEEREATLEVAVARLIKADPPELEAVKSASDKLRDADGNYWQQTAVQVEPAPRNMSRLLTKDLVIAYGDLALDPGEHQLAIQARLSGQGFEPVLAISDLVKVTISKTSRVLESPAGRDDLMRWQQPKVFSQAKEVVRSVLPLTARTIRGGFESQGNDPQERKFFAETEVAEIHFATNREAHPWLEPTARAEYFFNAVPAADISLGKCRVQVLRRNYEQTKAVRRRPLSFGELQNYFLVVETHFAERADWQAELSAHDVLLYVHGYDNTFEDALLRAAQLHLDLEFPGRTVAFSWPSLGKDVIYEDDDPERAKLAYHDDLKAADASVAALADTIQTLAERGGAGRRIHVVAHSLGNRVLLAALKKLADDGKQGMLDQVVLAAPDVAVTELQDCQACLSQVSSRTSVYSSTKDVALYLSSNIHRMLDMLLGERAGRITRCYSQVDAISADQVNSIFAMNGGHCYFAEAPQMVQELQLVICHRLPAIERSTLQSRTCSAAEERSWDLRK